MLSVINAGLGRCFYDQPKVTSKTIYISQYIPWADFAIGLILCLIGALCAHGVIPLSTMGAKLIIGGGLSQILLTIVVCCFPCCKTCAMITKTAVSQRSLNQFRDIISPED